MSNKSPLPEVCTPLANDPRAISVIDYYLLSDEEKAKLGGVQGRAVPKLTGSRVKKDDKHIDL